VFVSVAQWDAVLLFDEADVIFEKRFFGDFERDGIVSVFLRMLEYYEGILFITTNRLSIMDPAFQSGREIRNVLTIARSLALAKRKSGGGLQFEHVDQVADETMKFQGHFLKAEAENRHNGKTKFPDNDRKAVSRRGRMIKD
jgi:hypothetical protein